MSKPHFIHEQLPNLAAQLPSFERNILELASLIGINLSDYHIDHIALRVNDNTQGTQWLSVLAEHGNIISDNIINGRPIYLVELHFPLHLFSQSIRIVELPMPKKMYPFEGWEHIEVVVPLKEGESPQQWCERMLTKFHLRTNTALSLKIDRPQGRGEQVDNTTIAITKPDKKENKCCIKLHSHSIIEVINN
ncbi:VOC family protein [Spirabiliibacterium falconis]|uniref:VOC family protein n=1 Tax=Spirabiliibacterium falconis TaxID=572023 RepID=UPI001AACA9F1|nr:VOC family protein [Spirabiliibacterium falconis]MBE2894145.1 VOC family protein [Spirabiliibacterium falconis]